MNWGSKKNKTIAFITASLFVVTGTFNAVVINSDSSISGNEVKFVKRLDELYGVTVQGREVATSVSWQKLEKVPTIAKRNVVVPSQVQSSAPEAAPSPEEVIPAAAVQEDLTLSLVEVIHPTKYKDALKPSDFNGSLVANNGVIESLSASLPNGEGLSVSFSEMTGNVFEYDLNGELYSGMMYQVDQNAYMVTLTNGPLEGTRLRFSAADLEAEQEQAQLALAESNNIQTGNFGEEVQEEEMVQNDVELQQEGIEAQAFNMGQSEATF
jgi:hypothetical protein